MINLVSNWYLAYYTKKVDLNDLTNKQINQFEKKFFKK